MEIVEKGETLSEWFLANVHTCHRCKTKFRAGKKAKAGRDYELHEATLSRGSVGVKCPHCGGDLWLHAPTDPPTFAPLPYVPVPYPVCPTWPRPWYPGIWYGGATIGDISVTPNTTVFSQSAGAGASVTALPEVDGVQVTCNVNALAANGSGVFEIVN